jgi:hypothetical protein
LSYGRGRVEVVLVDEWNGRAQGAVCALPIPDFPTGTMRGRFHPTTGELYLCGLSAWASSQTLQEGGLYRLRPTGRPMHLPVSWRVGSKDVEITFSDPLPAEVLGDVRRYTFSRWNLKRSANYGSPRLDERALPIERAEPFADGRGVRLTIPQLEPADVVEITCRLADAKGKSIERVLHGTIHFTREINSAAAESERKLR